MKKLVITGVTSFIGFHLARKLAPLFKIIATTTAKHETYTGIQKKRLDLLQGLGINFDLLDVTKNDQLSAFIQRHRPNLWINHAGYTKNYASFNYDEALADTIHSGPLETLFQELKNVGCESFIGTGTCSEYSDTDFPHKESELCAPSTPYGKSKLKQTLKSIELGQKYQIPTSIIRVFIPYGDYDDPKKLFPSAIQKLWNDEEIGLTPGTQARNFIHVEELVHLYFLLLSHNRGYEIYNGGSVYNLSVRNYIEKITKEQRLDTSLLKFGAHPMREGETLFLTANLEKLHSFYFKVTQGKYYLIEEDTDLKQILELTPFILCTNPRLKIRLEEAGTYVFDSLSFFSAEDHFALSKLVNELIATDSSELDNKFDPDSIFSLMFSLQFKAGKKLFKELMHRRVLERFPFITANKTELPVIKQAHETCSHTLALLNYSLLTHLPNLSQIAFVTTDAPLLVDYARKKNPSKRVGLLACSSPNKKPLAKTIFNAINFLPLTIRRAVYARYYKCQYDFIFDATLLGDKTEIAHFTSKLPSRLRDDDSIRVAHHYSVTQKLEHIFSQNPPFAFFHESNVDIMRFLGRISKKLNIPSFLISHGSHAKNENPLLAIDLKRHGDGLILSDTHCMVAQSNFAADFIKSNTRDSYINEGPVVWGKHVTKNISLRERYNIAKENIVILHASTPKSINSRRFVIYETPEEYLNNIFKIAETLLDHKNITLVIKYRESMEIDGTTLQKRLAPFTNLIIDKEIPFLEALQEANLLMSYSSTTMEEALSLNVPVLQYSHIKDFRFLPLEVANCYNLEKKISSYS